MQTKPTQRLAKRIRKQRERRTPVLWRVICEKFGIWKADGEPDTGMAYKIAYDDHEPEDRDVRTRLGLNDMCVKCQRAFRKPGAKGAERADWQTWWARLRPRERETIIRYHYSHRDIER
jgi:hypothetical protein